MKTVIYANVDGYDTVLGFSDAIVDPMASAIIVGPLLASSDEAKTISNTNAQLDAINLRLGRETLPGAAYSPALLAQAETLGNSLTDLGKALDAKRASLMAEHSIYCTPHPGEAFCTEEQYAAYQAAEKPGYRVKLDGTAIVDNRNAVYWLKTKGTWTQTVITCLGVEIPDGAVLQSALTDDQRTEIATQMQTERVAALTDAQKLAEAQSVQQSAKSKVVQVAGEVSAGISEQSALDAAKAEYQATLAEINEKYGTSLV